MFDKAILSALSPLTPEEEMTKRGEIPYWRRELSHKGVIAVERKAMLSSGLLFNLRRHPRLLPFPPHVHDHVELMVMIQGRSVHHVNGKQLTLQEGELLLLGQGTLHEVENTEEDDLAIYINILPEFFGNIFGMFENTDSVIRFFCLDTLSGGKSGMHLLYHTADNLRIRYMLNFILYNLLFKPEMYKTLVKNAFGLLFQLLQACNDDLEVFSLDHSAIMPAVKRYIEEHYDEGSLDVLAAQLHYNKSSLSRFIKRSTGENFIDLLQGKRLEIAGERLLSTRKSIAEIALETGYDNVSYFHKLFKRKYGVSPNEYRNHSHERLPR